MDGGREGGPWDAKTDVHPPGQPGYWGALDAEGGDEDFGDGGDELWLPKFSIMAKIKNKSQFHD